MYQERPRIRYTYRDYTLLPEGKRYEVIDGELFVVPAPGFAHQTVVGNLFEALRRHVRARRLGVVLAAPFDVVLSDEDVFQPDVLFISSARRHILTPANARGAPDLVVEVLSPATRERDLELKRKRYADFGVAEYWVVDPEARAVTVLALGTGEYREAGTFCAGQAVASPLLPGLTLAVDEVFQDV